MQEIWLRVINEVGLHALPASQFVQMANKFASIIRGRNLTSSSAHANGRIILGVLIIGVQRNQEIEITAEGPDEVVAVKELRGLIDSDFDLTK